jgi:glycosyltransferase involved in cell wall biosynthesis
MKVLLIHNHYRSSSPSGEDSVVKNECKLLEENGVETFLYEKFNDDIDDSSFLKRLEMGFDCAWSRRTYDELTKMIKRIHPDIAHIHSVHPQISPSAYAACQEMGVPVVHTLHNYRYICPGGLLLRDGRPCEDCVGRFPVNGLLHRCYRQSITATGALVWMIGYNRWRGTFGNLVNRFIALTDFAASRLAAGGIPADRIEVKPNFLQDVPVRSQSPRTNAVYVGRLSAEKGVKTLLSAWRSVKGVPLRIIGDGPLRAELEAMARPRKCDVEFMGTLPKDGVLSTAGGALLQVVPSECYEGCPMALLEAFACGTPVVASRIGSLAEIVVDGETGLHFVPGDPVDLAGKVNALAENTELASRLGRNARETYLRKYSPGMNFKMLMGIYQRAREDFEMRRA